jgi:hypothetical protein
MVATERRERQDAPSRIEITVASCLERFLATSRCVNTFLSPLIGAHRHTFRCKAGSVLPRVSCRENKKGSGDV